MKSLVVMTYYQLMHSIALALTFEEKPNLYFSMGYLNPEDSLLERIRDTGVFNQVVGITRRGENREFLIEFRKTAGCSEEEIDAIGSSLFEKYLEPHYKELFKDADPEDEIYVYNDFQWHFYYISKHFTKIVGVEDGYASLQQQISIHRPKGDAEMVIPFIEKGYYPKNLYRSENITRIISSKSFDELDDYYKNKLEVWDFKEIVQYNKAAFRDALLYIFNLEGFTVPEGSSLILGQPLDRAKYCTPIQNYFLNRIYVRNELAHSPHVYIKPHPAEKSDPRIFGREGVEVMSRAFPIELLNYQKGRFSRVATFSSTGASMVTCTDEEIKYFDKTDTSREEVTRFIEEMVRDEKLEVDFFLRVRDMTPERYIAVYSSLFRREQIHTNLHILVPRDEAEKFCEYYAPEVMDARIEEYKEARDSGKESELWHTELRKMKRWYKKYAPTVDFCQVSSFDDWIVFKEVIRDYRNYDYMILLDAHKPVFKDVGRIFGAFEAKMPSAVYFSAETEYVDDKGVIRKITIDPGYLENAYKGRLEGTLFHRALIRELGNGNADECRLSEIITSYEGTISTRPSISFYMSPYAYPDAERGEAYYKDKAASLVERYREAPEYMAGQLSHVLYDYYIWGRISGATNKKVPSLEAVEDVIQDQEILFRTYRAFARALLYQRARVDANQFFQESYFYRGMKSQIDKAAKAGMFTRMEEERKSEKKKKGWRLFRK